MHFRNLLALAFPLGFCGLLQAEEFRIKDFDKVTYFNQDRDFSPLMTNLPTRVKINDAAVKIKDLDGYEGAADGKPTVLFDPKNAQIYAGENPAVAPVRNFMQTDDLAIESGAFHCVPTSAAMLFQYYAAKYPKLAVDASNEAKVTAYIHAIAFDMDTDGQNKDWSFGKDADDIPDIRNRRAYYGTMSDAVTLGFIQAADDLAKLKPTVNREGFNPTNFKKIIDANRPVMLALAVKDSVMGHMVVAIGYDTGSDGKISKLIVRDPNDPNNTESIIDVPKITAVRSVSALEQLGATRFNPYGDVSITVPDAFSEMSAEMYDVSFEPVPEPASLMALGLGATALLRRRRR